MAERQRLEEPTALSESVLWSLVREYYQREGIRAWSHGVVPEMITTNAVMGASYARMVAAFLHEWRADAGSAPIDPVHIIEIGAGSGRFAYHFLTKLTPRVSVPALQDVTVRHVMTDLPGGNVDRWRRHPYLRRHADAGRLDFATLDATRPGPLHLVESGAVLSPASTSAPLVVIANYVLDSLPLDAYIVDGDGLDEYLVSVTASEFEAGRPPGMDDLELNWSRRWVSDAPRYTDVELETLLRAVTAGPARRSVLFPTHAIHLLRVLRSFTTGPVLIVSGDKGYCRPSDRVYEDGPYMAVHGSGSFMVDFSVIAAYVRARRGLALLPPHRAGSLTVVSFVLDEGRHAWPGVTQAYQDSIEVGGPDDFFAIDQQLSEITTVPTLTQLLSRLRASEWDSSVFRRVCTDLMLRATTAEAAEREAIRDAVRQVEELYYPIGEAADIPFGLAVLSWRAGDPDGGLRLLRWSEKLHGADPERAFAMGLCHFARGDVSAAVDSTIAAIRLDPGFTLAREFGSWITGEGQASAGVDPLEWGNGIIVADKSVGSRAFRYAGMNG